MLAPSDEQTGHDHPPTISQIVLPPCQQRKREGLHVQYEVKKKYDASTEILIDLPDGMIPSQ